MSIPLKALDGSHRIVSDAMIARLRGDLAGTAIVPGEPGYDEARTIWNAMIDRRPGLVIRAAGVADIRAAVDFARDNGLMIAIRSGGHQIAGLAVADGAMMLDVSGMRAVSVDPTARTARVEPGATLADVDAATQAHGLALPMGINSTTGIAGLTLGGGFGWTARKLGMTIDNLIAADVVTANGHLVRASAEENPDLFWAIRGGGGNFGVVAAFEFRLHALGPEVLAGLIVHPFDEAATLLRDFRRIAAEAPDELTVWVVMRKAPPLPFLPEEWHGREVLVFAACYAGSVADGEKAMAGLRAIGNPIADVIGPVPVRRLAAGLRPAADARGTQLLEEPRLHRAVRRRAGRDRAGGPDAAGSRSARSSSAISAARWRGFRPRRRAFGQRSAHFTMNVHTRWERPRRRRHLHRLGARPLRADGAVRGRQRLRQLHARGRGRPGRRRLRREHGTTAADQGDGRSDEPLPGEPQHRARLRSTRGGVASPAPCRRREPPASRNA